MVVWHLSWYIDFQGNLDRIKSAFVIFPESILFSQQVFRQTYLILNLLPYLLLDFK